MNKFYKPDNFKLYELIPQEYFERWKDFQHKVWQAWDYRVLYTLQKLRDRYGKMRMNNWYWGGPNQFKGWRPLDYEGLDNLSMHKWFKAADPTPTEENSEKVRQDVLADPFCEDFKYITCIEMNITWVHFDVRNWDKNNQGILKVYP